MITIKLALKHIQMFKYTYFTFQMHFPYYSLFIVWIVIIHTSWIYCTYVNFCWILSRVGIHGNNEAGKAAKPELDFEIVFETLY